MNLELIASGTLRSLDIQPSVTRRGGSLTWAIGDLLGFLGQCARLCGCKMPVSTLADVAGMFWVLLLLYYERWWWWDRSRGTGQQRVQMVQERARDGAAGGGGGGGWPPSDWK